MDIKSPDAQFHYKAAKLSQRPRLIALLRAEMLAGIDALLADHDVRRGRYPDLIRWASNRNVILNARAYLASAPACYFPDKHDWNSDGDTLRNAVVQVQLAISASRR